MLESFHVLVIYVFHSFSKMITKMETSACVTNDVSLELTYEYLQKRKYTSLKGCSSPKGRKVKAKVWELIFLNIVPISMAI
jgi:hypothetical protein